MFLVMRGAPTLITSHNYIGTLRGAPVTLLSYKKVSANDVCDGKRENMTLRDDIIPVGAISIKFIV